MSLLDSICWIGGSATFSVSFSAARSMGSNEMKFA
ncbi:hypothetical protein SLEP1_g38761 [Rubroshorea leprosula]|uniref:Uncharacterized protein n=1 Tax=Rubroshorea leprosula TaxID=152421 RepID=A0AAV5KYE4_9ROSI|nr:hypothetical protein SLEP1_g38761 [Rubroshorea leprosula]